MGKLPDRIEVLQEQVERTRLQLSKYKTAIQKNIFLNNLHDKNQILFYKFLEQHLSELIPIIYTPTVGLAVKAFSHEYRQPRGLYISHTHQDDIDLILENRSNPDIDLIVVTDGEGVLGIGDQGIGGMDIPVAKLMVYSACGGIDPSRTLPIFLDVGTNNPELLEDPLYLGCKHNRIDPKAYDKFIDKFVSSIKRKFPRAFLHWEDLGRDNARRLLDQYKDKLCTFNDDIQGTGATTLAALLAASRVTGLPLSEHRILVYGAGSAGTGVSDQIQEALLRHGLSAQEAYQRFWLVDRQGLLMEDDPRLTAAQKPYARSQEDLKTWAMAAEQSKSLLEIVKNVQPTILIGCSTQAGHFTQEVIQAMASHTERPIIFPLSNPDELCEAQPIDILTWTQGKALVATGTAFDDVQINDRRFTIAQCNNALVYPGIGLGIIAVRASRLNSEMLWAAAQALAELSPSAKDPFLALLPALDEAELISKKIAVAVAKTAIEQGIAEVKESQGLDEIIEKHYWRPKYLSFNRLL